MRFFSSAALALGLMMSTSAFADGHGVWTSMDEHSQIAFGSVKKNTTGEVHHFNSIKGTVDAEGQLTLSIDLSSVETNIDIRNERMAKHVFNDGTAKATVVGSIDMDDVQSLSVGDVMVTDFEGVLTLGVAKVDIEAEMLVARLADNRVMVSTADFIMLSTEDLGIDAGIDALMALAKLPSITRVTPVSIRAVFEK